MLRFGILGEHLPHTLSPELHADFFRQQGIDAVYTVLERSKEDVVHILEEMKEHQITGINVTIPYKETLYHMVDVVDPHAEQIGAINTVMQKNGMFYGYNTDYLGAASMFHKAGVSIKGQKVVLLGSGGASRALIYAMHIEGASKITIAARNEQAKQALKDQFPYIQTCDLDKIPAGDILINTTPVGMYPKTGVSPIPSSVFQYFSVAADIIYNPFITEFLRLAQQAGLQIITGLMMLVDQAIASEEIWLDKTLDYTMGTEPHDRLAKRFL